MSNLGTEVSLDNSLMPNMLRIANARALSTLFEGYRQRTIFFESAKRGKLTNKQNLKAHASIMKNSIV